MTIIRVVLRIQLRFGLVKFLRTVLQWIKLFIVKSLYLSTVIVNATGRNIILTFHDTKAKKLLSCLLSDGQVIAKERQQDTISMTLSLKH